MHTHNSLSKHVQRLSELRNVHRNAFMSRKSTKYKSPITNIPKATTHTIMNWLATCT